MTVGRGWRRFLRLGLRGSSAGEVDDEIAFHVAMRAESLQRGGLPADDARARAVAAFGDAAQIRDECLTIHRRYGRRQRITEAVTSLASDVRYAVRTVRRAPGFAVGAVLALGLGMGATTAIFSVVDQVLLRPLPFPAPDRLVQLFGLDKDGKRISLSEPNFRDWKQEARGFAAMVQLQTLGPVTVNGLAEPLRATAASVSRDFFAVFGLAPVLGRPFTDDETRIGGPPAVVVSHAFWTRELGGDRSALERGLTIAGRRFTVVGVMPAAMDYPVHTDLWLPHGIDEPNPSRSSGGWRVVARLAPGVSADAASDEVRTVSRRMKQEYGKDTWMSDADLVPLQAQLVGGARAPLLIAFGASAFLLLIACANVTNLLVARLAARRGEIGIRVALGASRGRLARQLLAEAAVLGGAGGALGLALAAAGVRALVAQHADSLPRATDVQVDWRMLVFAITLAAAASLVLGLLATWQGTRGAIRETLSSVQRTQAGSGSGAIVRRGLAVSQVALTVVLLVGAAVLGRSFLRLMSIDPGYRTQRVVVLSAPIPYQDGDSAAVRRAQLYHELMARLAVVPGVLEVGASSGVPLTGGGSDGEFLILHSTTERVTYADWTTRSTDPSRTGYANFDVVAGDYFRAMGIPVLRGRPFAPSDTRDGPHVAMISASLAQAKWPNEDPIGKVVDFGNMDGDLRPATIIGVVGDVRDQSLASAPQPPLYAYQPQRPLAGQELSVIVHTAGDPAAVIAAARSILRDLRPDVPMSARLIETAVADSVADRRFVLMLIGTFAGAALVLATLGVYSVISYLVSLRRREIGVRLALGAEPGDVLRLVIRQGAVLAVVGVGVGTAGAFLLTRLLRGLVFGVSPTDPLAFGAVVALLGIVALVASWVPARRASHVDPATVLRES